MNDVDKLVRRYPAVEPVIEASRRLLAVAFPGSTATADPKAGVIAYGYGAGYKNMVATLILGRRSVKIGIPYSAAFDDPLRLLAGTGKVHRHVAIESIDDLSRPGVSELLAASREAWKRRTANAGARKTAGAPAA
jgi:hypothetical protein